MKTMKLMALLVVAFSVNAASATAKSSCKVAKDAEAKLKANQTADLVFKKPAGTLVNGKGNGIT